MNESGVLQFSDPSCLRKILPMFGQKDDAPHYHIYASNNFGVEVTNSVFDQRVAKPFNYFFWDHTLGNSIMFNTLNPSRNCDAQVALFNSSSSNIIGNKFNGNNMFHSLYSWQNTISDNQFLNNNNLFKQEVIFEEGTLNSIQNNTFFNTGALLVNEETDLFSRNKVDSGLAGIHEVLTRMSSGPQAGNTIEDNYILNTYYGFITADYDLGNGATWGVGQNVPLPNAGLVSFSNLGCNKFENCVYAGMLFEIPNGITMGSSTYPVNNEFVNCPNHACAVFPNNVLAFNLPMFASTGPRSLNFDPSIITGGVYYGPGSSTHPAYPVNVQFVSTPVTANCSYPRKPISSTKVSSKAYFYEGILFLNEPETISRVEVVNMLGQTLNVFNYINEKEISLQSYSGPVVIKVYYKKGYFESLKAIL